VASLAAFGGSLDGRGGCKPAPGCVIGSRWAEPYLEPASLPCLVFAAVRFTNCNGNGNDNGNCNNNNDNCNCNNNNNNSSSLPL
jgi:hypothetical protein